MTVLCDVVASYLTDQLTAVIAASALSEYLPFNFVVKWVHKIDFYPLTRVERVDYDSLIFAVRCANIQNNG